MRHDKHDKAAVSSSLTACVLSATSIFRKTKGGDRSHSKGGFADSLAGFGSHHIHHRAAPPATHSAGLQLQSTSLSEGPHSPCMDAERIKALVRCNTRNISHLVPVSHTALGCSMTILHVQPRI